MDEFEKNVVLALIEQLPKKLYPGKARRRQAVGLFRSNMVFVAVLRFERNGTPTEIATEVMNRPMSQYDIGI